MEWNLSGELRCKNHLRQGLAAFQVHGAELRVVHAVTSRSVAFKQLEKIPSAMMQSCSKVGGCVWNAFFCTASVMIRFQAF
jgi:hypothetical protein